MTTPFPPIDEPYCHLLGGSKPSPSGDGFSVPRQPPGPAHGAGNGRSRSPVVLVGPGRPVESLRRGRRVDQEGGGWNGRSIGRGDGRGAEALQPTSGGIPLAELGSE